MLKRFFRRRALTGDRGTSQAPIHTVEQIGPKRHMTHEGFLVCEDVPISRVGVMLYGPGEVPLQPGEDGRIWVERTADELFDEDTIASFNGKPVVNEHPPSGVNPGNYNSLVLGVVLHPRRGTGDDSDVLLADLMITERQMIRDINAGKREVSAGYEADYHQLGPGRGNQSAIIGNHVALVERGRCGPRCAIGDHSPEEEHLTMPKQTVTIPRRTVTPPARRTAGAAAVRQAFKDALSDMEAMGLDPNDEGEGDDDFGGGGNGDTHIHIHADGSTGPSATAGDEVGDPMATGGGGEGGDPNEARFQRLEAGLAQVIEAIGKLGSGAAAPAAPPAAKTGDEATDPPPKGEGEEEEGTLPKTMTGDSVALETGFKAMLSDAEILLPGVSLPAFDPKTNRAATVDSMCGFRRRILDGVMLTADGAALLNGLNADGGTLDLAKHSCNEVGLLFKAAAHAKRAENNRSATGDGKMGIPNAPTPPASKRPLTIAELNKANREFYEKQPQPA